MILSSDELEVLDYLKSFKGDYISMVEICRCAGGRNKYKDSPHWARRLMGRLVDEQLIEVNERGHYRTKPQTVPLETAANGNALEDYFAPPESALIVGDDYFPPPEPPPPPKKKTWVSPQIESILKKAGKKPAKSHATTKPD
jgi:hypothetical protein